MPERAIIDTLDFNKSDQYTLSIRLSTDGFSFSIYNPISDSSIYHFQKEVNTELSFTANLKQAFKELDFLTHTYKRVNILIVGRRHTLLPLELFDDEAADTLFYYNHTPKENEKVLYHVLRKCGIVILYAIDKSAYSFLNEHYPKARFYSQASPLVEYFSIKSRQGNTKKMYACIHKEAIDLYCLERGQLLLMNTFACKSTTDRVYYLLYVWKQLNMDQLRDELHISAGQIADKELLLKELQRFIQQVFIINPRAELTRSATGNIDQVPFDMQILLSNND